TWEIERAGSEAAARCQVDCARAFVSMAYRRARRAIRATAKNEDGRLAAIAKCALADGDLGPEMPTSV
ncbi:MAG: hypothetical protein ACREPM_09845, partial [Gemmatimonadaceae bacterium]